MSEEPNTPTDVRAPLTPLTRKVAFTAAAVVLYWGARFVPLVGIDRERLFELMSGSDVLRAYGSLPGAALASGSVASLGIVPYIAGTVIALLLSAIIPPLRAIRDDPSREATFDRWIMGATLTVGLVQGWGAALAFGAPETGMRVLQASVLALTSALAARLAIEISDRGIANGVVILLLADLFLRGLLALVFELTQIARGVQNPVGEVLPLLAIVGLFVACERMMSAGHALPIFDGDRPLSVGPALQDPVVALLRYNSVGTVPVKIGWFASAAAAMIFGGRMNGGVASFLVSAAAIILGTYLWTAFTFSSEDLVARVKRAGCTVRGEEGTELTAAEIDRLMERQVLPFALFLVALSASPWLFAQLPPIHPALLALTGPTMLFIAAASIEIKSRVRTERRQAETGSRDGGDEMNGWVAIYEGETELDVAIARGLLRGAGVESLRSASRAICAMGTLGYWESCRPTFPAITVHRRLGGGAVMAKVRRSDAERAAEVLAARLGTRAIGS